ncbi:hypothetical protein BDR03DRAFT_986973 [Suillus americanus]|nr:hypothetical protein BDR03DRAFT_986973 [Suillus americanus]
MLLTAKSIAKKGYHCPIVTCAFVGLPAALYTHILTHVNRPLEDPFSPYLDTLFGGSPSSTVPINKLNLLTPPSGANPPLGDGKTPLKKQHVSLESPTTPSSPTPLPNDADEKTTILESYLNDYGGVCPLHGLSSSLPHLAPHTDLCTCDLVNASFYLGHYRKTIHRYINKPILCSSCSGCKRFEHPVWACDNDALQDFWLDIPYLVFTIPVITQNVFNSLGVQYTDEITDSIHLYGTWLYMPSTNGAIISSGYPQLYDLIHT